MGHRLVVTLDTGGNITQDLLVESLCAARLLDDTITIRSNGSTFFAQVVDVEGVE